MTSSYLITHTPVAGCPFCGRVRAEAIAHYPPDVPIEQATAYLVKAKDSPNDDDYLVIPCNHAENEGDLPGNFTAACNYLRWFIPWMEEATDDPQGENAAGYHTGVNYGVAAGQTVVHVHQWYSLVPRGMRVFGIATYTKLERLCWSTLHNTLTWLVEGAITLKKALSGH